MPYTALFVNCDAIYIYRNIGSRLEVRGADTAVGRSRFGENVRARWESRIAYGFVLLVTGGRDGTIFFNSNAIYRL